MDIKYNFYKSDDSYSLTKNAKNVLFSIDNAFIRKHTYISDYPNSINDNLENIQTYLLNSEIESLFKKRTIHLYNYNGLIGFDITGINLNEIKHVEITRNKIDRNIFEINVNSTNYISLSGYVKVKIINKFTSTIGEKWNQLNANKEIEIFSIMLTHLQTTFY